LAGFAGRPAGDGRRARKGLEEGSGLTIFDRRYSVDDIRTKSG
jgi:hypothetical protein